VFVPRGTVKRKSSDFLRPVIKTNACQLSRHFACSNAGAEIATMAIYCRAAGTLETPLGDTAEI